MKKLTLRKTLLLGIVLLVTACFSINVLASNNSSATTSGTVTSYSSSNSSSSSKWPSIFQPSKGDISIKYLKATFGYVADFLDGDEALLNKMFKSFNTVVMALAFILLMYILIFVIGNMASRGEFLGKKNDSPWWIARTMVGVGCCVPLKFGYSLIQIFMMWVVVQGVGAADTLWSNVVDYLSKDGGSLLSADDLQSTAVGISNIDNTYTILQSLTCMQQEYYNSKSQVWINGRMTTSPFKGSYDFTPKAETTTDGLVKVKLDYYAANPGASSQYSSVPHLEADASGNIKPSTTQFYKIPDDDHSCGYVQWKAANTSGDDAANATLRNAENSGLQDLISTLTTTATDIVKAANNGDKSAFNGDESNPLETSTKYLNNVLKDAQEQQQQAQSSTDDSSSIWNDMKDKGWMNAGGYYLDIVLQNASTLDSDLTKLDDSFKVVGPGTNSAIGTSSDSAKQDASSPWKYLNDIYQQTIGASSSTSAGDVASSLGTTIQDQLDLVGALNINDPIVDIAILGNVILEAVIAAWAVLLVALGVIASGLSVVSYFIPAVSTLYQVAVLGFAPLIALMAALFSAGMLMAIYIPMIPYIIFTFAAIGWLIAVLETMIAAPLVAIGLLDIHGQHEVLGRAEPAVQLLINVFLRPTLMLFGLLGGIIISRVALIFMNATFWHMEDAINGLFSQTTGDILYLLYLMIFICLWVLLVIGIVNRSYSLIHIIPDRVLSWLGWQSQFGEYSKGAEQEIKQGFKGASGQIGGMGKATIEGVKGAQDKFHGEAVSRGKMARTFGYKSSLKHLFMGDDKRKEGGDKTNVTPEEQQHGQ
jgi:conjugal transfer/type IV secretion protein DotA/TraY